MLGKHRCGASILLASTPYNHPTQNNRRGHLSNDRSLSRETITRPYQSSLTEPKIIGIVVVWSGVYKPCTVTHMCFHKKSR
jgi:hypothetical protein